MYFSLQRNRNDMINREINIQITMFKLSVFDYLYSERTTLVMFLFIYGLFSCSAHKNNVIIFVSSNDKSREKAVERHQQHTPTVALINNIFRLFYQKLCIFFIHKIFFYLSKISKFLNYLYIVIQVFFIYQIF